MYQKNKVAIGTIFKTGQNCQESGVYRFAGYTDGSSSHGATTTIPLAENNTFPPYNNKGAFWRLESYA